MGAWCVARFHHVPSAGGRGTRSEATQGGILTPEEPNHYRARRGTTTPNQTIPTIPINREAE